MFPTSGPENRYSNILFIEKEGFDPLLETARIAERFDIAIMSTKGMSVTAARLLLDRLAATVNRVLVLHDFDLSGFSIAGTLATDGRRYSYANKIEVVDLGLRLNDVIELGLQSEPVKVEGDHDARAATLREHGATRNEVQFLLGLDGNGTKRVELNAMPSDMFVAFLERKLIAAGVEKVVPNGDVIERHGRRLIEQEMIAEAVKKISERIAKRAKAHALPADLAEQIRALLTERPELSWDYALAQVLQRRKAA